MSIKIPTEDCLAAPTGLIASLEAVPTAGWLQIMLSMCMLETGALPLARAQTGGFASNGADNDGGDDAIDCTTAS